MQRSTGRKDGLEAVAVKSPSKVNDKFLQLKETLLLAGSVPRTEESLQKSYNKCKSSDSYRSVEKVLQKIIPIIEKNVSKVRISTLTQSPDRYRCSSNLHKQDELESTAAGLPLKQTRAESFKSIRRFRVNVMNLQLVPGQEPGRSVELENNRVKEMVEKRRLQSSMEREKQKHRFKLACSSLLENKYVKLNFQDSDHNNRFVKHILETLKCSRIETQTQEDVPKTALEDRKKSAPRASEEIPRPRTQYHTTNAGRQSSSSLVRKSSAMHMKKMVFCMSDFPGDKIYKKKIDAYLDFLYKVNFSNMIYVDLRLLEDSHEHLPRPRVFVGRGNNCKLIKSLIKRRFWLDIVDDSKGANIYWTQSKLKNIHATQVDHRPTELSQKEKLEAYKLPRSARKEDNQKILSKSESRIVENYILAESYNKSVFPRVTPSIVTNHIPQNSLIGSKKALFHSLHYYYKYILLTDPFEFIPLTFHIKSPSDLGFKDFQEYIKTQPKDKVWIVKPGENTNRGNGINLAYASQITSLITKKKLNSNGTPRTYIIQSYINQPFLYNSRKFDIRHYLLITSVNGIMKAFWYQDGYIRTSSEAFDLQDISNKYVHLTNDAIQKHGDDYGKYELGNKLSYTQFQRYLDMVYPAKKYSFEGMIVPKMRELAADAVRANFLNMDTKKKLNNFEVYGMDFMIDSNFRPWLIEINANPCLEMSCPLLTRIIPPLIENCLRLGLDPLFPPPSHYPPSRRFQLSDNFLPNLRFQMIFDERLERKSMQQKIQEGSKQMEIMDDISDFEEEYEDEGEEIQQIEC